MQFGDINNGVLLQWVQGYTETNGIANLTYPCAFTGKNSVIVCGQTDVKNSTWSTSIYTNSNDMKNLTNFYVSCSITGYKIWLESIALGICS